MLKPCCVAFMMLQVVVPKSGDDGGATNIKELPGLSIEQSARQCRWRIKKASMIPITLDVQLEKSCADFQIIIFFNVITKHWTRYGHVDMLHK